MRVFALVNPAPEILDVIRFGCWPVQYFLTWDLGTLGFLGGPLGVYLACTLTLESLYLTCSDRRSSGTLSDA